jgi:Ni,Fe-hydrogenase I large subunit
LTTIYKKHWKELTPKQKSQRTKSLAVLTQARRTKKIPSVIAKENHISLKTVINHTNGFKKVNNRWVAKKYDHTSRSMIISENGKMQSIEISDSRHAKTIGRYHNAVKFYLDTGDDSKLKKFTKRKIKDSNGNLHSFETDPKIVEEINEKIEEIEFFEVYDS